MKQRTVWGSVVIGAFLFIAGSEAGSEETTARQCVDGVAAGHQCAEVDLGAKLNLRTSGVSAGNGNDIWGWTDPTTGREYAIMALDNKTSFVDVSDPENPIHLADVKTATYRSTWRDVKVYANHAFIVSEASGHGMQVFDLTRLRNVVNPPVVLDADARYTNFGSAHNIVINEETGFAYAVGSTTCDAGMHVVDIRNPLQPTFSTCVDRTIFDDVKTAPRHGEDYTHDAQCLIYRGPDSRYYVRELCFCSNADTVNIVDVTDKAAPQQISVKRYNGRGYTHQGWLTEDHRYFILGDELDESKFGHKTKTLIWDMADLEAPEHLGNYFSSQRAIDHNLYVRNDLVFQANYDSGLRILDLTNVADGELAEVGYFDTEPGSNAATFKGAWSVYPYFDSGTVIVSNMDGDLYVLGLGSTLRARLGL